MQNLMNIAAIGMGGAVGAILRLLVTNFCAARVGMLFPVGTLVVNIIGSALMGYILGLDDAALCSVSSLTWVFNGRHVWRVYYFFYICS